jgi:tetratricopeptide (TPR) repeat protein
MGVRAVRAFAVAVLLSIAGCAAKRPVAPAVPDLTSSLAEADALLAAGCFDCLREALDKYQAARAVTGAIRSSLDRATIGAFRAAALLAIRQHELGMVDDGFLQTARDLLPSLSCAGSPAACDAPGRLIEIIDVMPVDIPGVVARPADTDAQMAARLRFFRNRQEWLPTLRDAAAQDLLSAYTWLAFACGPAGNMTRAEAGVPVARFEDVPLIRFKRADCLTVQPDDLQGLVTANPRFGETAYPLGLAALGRLKTDEADAAFDKAYAWHPRWPAVTLSIANLAIAGEDFERALGFYDKTLELDAGGPEAMLGKVRALTYLGRYEAAIGVTDQLLQGRLYLGDTRYWRAMDEYQLGRLDAAWSDIEESAKLLVNALVPKLAGLIAYRRQQLDVARQKFEESFQRNAADCETGFYLGVTLADQRSWNRSAETFVGAVGCLENAARALEADVERIRRSDAAPARQARLIASRDRQIATGRRMIAQATFNTAVAYFNLSRDTEARPFAQRVADDEQFGDRARELLSRFR